MLGGIQQRVNLLSNSFQRDLLNKTQRTPFVAIWTQPSVLVWITPLVYIDTRQVDSSVRIDFPAWVFWMLGVNTILKHVYFLALKQEKESWSASFCRNLFSSQITRISLFFSVKSVMIVLNVSCSNWAEVLQRPLSHGWLSDPHCPVRKSISTSRSWLHEMFRIIIRLSRNQRSDWGGDRSYLRKASCYLSSWNRLGELEEADRAFIIAGAKKKSSSGRNGCQDHANLD